MRTLEWLGRRGGQSAALLLSFSAAASCVRPVKALPNARTTADRVIARPNVKTTPDRVMLKSEAYAAWGALATGPWRVELDEVITVGTASHIYGVALVPAPDGDVWVATAHIGSHGMDASRAIRGLRNAHIRDAVAGITRTGQEAEA